MADKTIQTGSSGVAELLSDISNGAGTTFAPAVVPYTPAGLPGTIPALGSIQRVSAGLVAPGQTAKSFAGTVVTNPSAAAPVAPTVAAGVGTLTGAYLWRVTFVSANGETQGGTATAPLTLTAQGGSLSAIPLGPTGTTQRKIYRTKAGGLDGSQQLATTLADNTTTTFLDSVADGSLGVVMPIRNTWAAAITVAFWTVTAGKIFMLTDIFFTTDAPAVVDVQVKAAGATIFNALCQNTAPVSAPGIETQPNAAAGQALTLVVQGTPFPQTVYYTLQAIEN